MSDANRPPTVAILAFPQTTASMVHGMYDLFMSAGRDWGAIVDGEPGTPLFRPLIVARSLDPVIGSNGIEIVPQATLVSCPTPDIVCICEITLPPGEPLAGLFGEEIAWLRRCHAAGATLGTACSGTMMLAEAGLLEGQEATTHWGWCEALRAFPGVRVHNDRALVVSGDGGRLVMAGGGILGFDLVLYLIARSVGIEAAMQLARVNLIDWHHVGQQPFARLARTRQVEDAVIAQCQTWIAEHYATSAPVAAMVRLSGLPERSFKRRFRQATGMAPLEYVHTLRLEEAKQMLEAGDAPIEAIAHEVGYEDAGFFSRLFKRKVALTPTQYRKRFGSTRRALLQ
jgi:transcriptional regulator GlxA family with amidase domain